MQKRTLFTYAFAFIREDTFVSIERSETQSVERRTRKSIHGCDVEVGFDFIVPRLRRLVVVVVVVIGVVRI